MQQSADAIRYFPGKLSSSITLGNEMLIYVMKPVMSADLFSHISFMSYVLTGPPLK